jgi:hypothetical protein
MISGSQSQVAQADCRHINEWEVRDAHGDTVLSPFPLLSHPLVIAQPQGQWGCERPWKKGRVLEKEPISLHPRDLCIWVTAVRCPSPAWALSKWEAGHRIMLFYCHFSNLQTQVPKSETSWKVIAGDKSRLTNCGKPCLWHAGWLSGNT